MIHHTALETLVEGSGIRSRVVGVWVDDEGVRRQSVLLEMACGMFAAWKLFSAFHQDPPRWGQGGHRY